MTTHVAFASVVMAALWLGGETAVGGPLSFEEAPGSPVAVGPMAGRPVLADCNRDGHLDILLACGTCCGSQPDPRSGHVVTLLGNGRGAFQHSGEPIKISSSVRKVAVGDVNGDWNVDIVAAEHDTYNVSVLFGDGQGRFSLHAQFPIASGERPHTHEIALGDVNADGRPDVLATNSNDRSISVLLNQEAGRFAHADGSPLVAARHPYDAIAIDDLNGDRLADIVVPDLAASAVVIMLGDGRGGFSHAPGSPVRVSARPGYVAVGDVNGDGHPDVCATHDDSGAVDVLLGDGTGRVAPAAGSPLMASVYLWGAVLHDLDADSDLDLVLGVMGDGGPVLVLNDGHGRFAEPVDLGLAGSMAEYPAVGDLNHDGRPDIVVGNYLSGDVTVLLAR